MSTTWSRIVALAACSMANPVAAAVLELHYPGESGCCPACTGDLPVRWPCPTVQAIEQTLTTPIRQG